MTQSLYHSFTEAKKINKKSFAVLIDPDKADTDRINRVVELAQEASVDFFFVGGSLMSVDNMDKCISQIKAACSIPVVLFPGSPAQVSNHADALLYLSLVSGRNPELLIGQHVISAALVKQSGLEIIPTAYMLVNGGVPTTVSYISSTFPIPADKNDIAVCTAMAAEMLGMKVVYMDAGSGAKYPISESMIEKVSANIISPLIVGGGICDPEKVYRNCKAGADIIVVGNAIEKNATLIKEMSSALVNSK